MLHHRKHPNTLKRAYAFAAVAKAEGVDFYYFSPGKVIFDHKIILGYVYENGKWIVKKMPFPDVIYNTGRFEKFPKGRVIVNELRKIIPFTTYSIGNKMEVYERLKKADIHVQYLIPTEYVLRDYDVIDFLDKYGKVVIKPIWGKKGEEVYYIEKCKDEKFIIIDQNISLEYNKKELENFIKAKIQEKTYIVQQFICCQTQTGQIYDFRLHVQKDGNGRWINTAIYPRIGPKGSMVSNISKGGSTNYLRPFLRQEFGEYAFNIEHYLEHFSLVFARKVDQIQQKLFNEPLDELGIDVGLDHNHKLWVYEVNWRPGCPPIFYLELDVVKNTILYAKYLDTQRKMRTK